LADMRILRIEVKSIAPVAPSHEDAGPRSGGFQPPPMNSACFRFNVTARHSFGGFGIALMPTRKISGQTTFRICPGSPHAARRSSAIASRGSRLLAAMKRCVEDHV